MESTGSEEISENLYRKIFVPIREVFNTQAIIHFCS